MNYWIIPSIQTRTPETIISMVEEKTGKNIREDSQKREVVEPRQVAMFLIREQQKLPLKEIGYIFTKNHATVIHACNTVENLIKTDKIFREKYKSIFDFFNINLQK